VMCSPWGALDYGTGSQATGIERYREPIERFARDIIGKVRS
jgi:hypothetical protein